MPSTGSQEGACISSSIPKFCLGTAVMRRVDQSLPNTPTLVTARPSRRLCTNLILTQYAHPALVYSSPFATSMARWGAHDCVWHTSRWGKFQSRCFHMCMSRSAFPPYVTRMGAYVQPEFQIQYTEHTSIMPPKNR